MAAQTNDADEMISGINITPLVDVVLVLLVVLDGHLVLFGLARDPSRSAQGCHR